MNDINFSEQQLVRSHDSELLEIFGNLVNRVLCMFHKYCNSTIPDCIPEPLFNIQGIVNVLENAMANFQIHVYIETVMALAAHVNKYVNDTKIWDVGKNGDVRTEKDRQIVLRTLLESFYVLGHFMYPIIPVSAYYFNNSFYSFSILGVCFQISIRTLRKRICPITIINLL